MNPRFDQPNRSGSFPRHTAQRSSVGGAALGRRSTQKATHFLLYLNKETFAKDKGLDLAAELRDARAAPGLCADA